jgi:hypothetical protein
MEAQQFINIIGGTFMLVLGWLGKTVWDAVHDLKNDVKKLEVELPTNYVRKADLDSRFDRLDIMLDRIWAKLDDKQDKVQ